MSRVIDSSNPSLTPQAAQGVLSLGYSDPDHARIADLAEKSNSGLLTIEEHRELEGYVIVCDLLAMMKSKARYLATVPRPLRDGIRGPAR